MEEICSSYTSWRGEYVHSSLDENSLWLAYLRTFASSHFTDYWPRNKIIMDALHSDVKITTPDKVWFTKPSLDSLGDLLVSMTQFRPSDRPTASDVLRHPWFQCSPSLYTVLKDEKGGYVPTTDWSSACVHDEATSA